MLLLYKVLECIPFSGYHNIYDFNYEYGQTNELGSGSIGPVTMWNTRTINQLSTTSLLIAWRLPRVIEAAAPEWPAFRECAGDKYPHELDEDLITMNRI